MTTQRIDTTALRGELEEILVRAAGVAADTLVTANDECLAELGLDSLAAMELQAVVQNRFGIRIPDESLEMTLPELTHFVVAALDGGV
ncbi:MAG TPA: acyl carrier protein [Pseudonocardiaceae bacterium]|nr:acyl carrier protein [Pseudonocardiaceae bacterium]